MFNFVLSRIYYKGGTNGIITLNGRKICYTIELPWKENQMQISCIPVGKYLITREYSLKFKLHIFRLDSVVGRSDILIHPANNAIDELHGCIAPVTLLTGQGKGLQSKKALDSFSIHYLVKNLYSKETYLDIRGDFKEYSKSNALINLPVIIS